MSKMLIPAIFVLLVSALIIVSCKGKANESPSKLKEVSTEIDLGNFKPFLIRIVPLIDSGFTTSDIDMILDEFQDLESGTENKYNYKIRYKGHESVMKIHVVKEDSDIVGLFILSILNLSDKMNEELSKFMEEKGL